MSNRLRTTKIYTMDDIAEELGISKSTVSRALSGSGRISAETRRKVEECANLHGFHPNLAAKALAGSRTLNLAAVMPLEATSLQMMFFHECLSGMVSRSAQAGYSILVCMTVGNDTSALESLVLNNKVDAAILTQLKKNDKNVELLKKNNFPFVVIGSGAGDDVPQIDSRMKESCAAFTEKCLSNCREGAEVLFVCGSLDVEANNNRLSGFMSAMEGNLGRKSKYAVCTDINDLEDLEKNARLDSWDLVLCSDDIVCSKVLEIMQEQGIEVGTDVKIGSFHDSVLLEGRTPSISALRVDAFSLGAEAASVVMRILSGSDVEKMNYVDCFVQMRQSV